MWRRRGGGGIPLAVEVDGPTHFMCSPPPCCDHGSTELRNRQLGRLQLRRLLLLPTMNAAAWPAAPAYHEWGATLNDLGLQLDMLRVKLM